MNLSKYLTPLIIAPALTFISPVLAQENEPDLNAKLAMYAKPAVVRIVSRCEGNYYLYDRPRKDPDAKVLSKITVNSNFIGTGFFINSNGYIVTSSKVTESESDCKNSLIRIIKEKLSNDYRYEKNKLDESYMNKIGELEYIFGGKKDKVGDRKYPGQWDVHFPLPPGHPSINKSYKPIEVEYSGRKEGQSLTLNKDIAIIKVAMTNAPTLQLADSSQVQIQDRVIAIGYPNTADIKLGQNVELTSQSYLESSVQEGIISNSSQKLEEGDPVFQVDIRTAVGSLGSPLLDEKGKVVGMLVFAYGDEKSDEVPVALPSSTLQEFIRRSGTTNEQSKTDSLYKEGLQKFWDGQYQEAIVNFLKVKNWYPLHSEVDKLIDEIAQSQRWDKPWTNLTNIFIAGLILATGAVGGRFYFLRKQLNNVVRAGKSQYKDSGATDSNLVDTSSIKSAPQTIENIESKLGQSNGQVIDRDRKVISKSVNDEINLASQNDNQQHKNWNLTTSNLDETKASLDGETQIDKSHQRMSYWQLGKQLNNGKFEVDKILGSGGFGVTYKIKAIGSNKFFAVKTLNIQARNRPDFDQLQTKFINEAIALASCSHPNIVRIYPQVFQEEGLWCMVMEYVEGEDLARYIERNGKLNEKQAISIITQVGEALSFVHQKGFLHRDIKPANILLRNSDLTPVLIDFGLAREFVSEQSMSMTNSRTESFAPIEQYQRRGNFGVWTDVYALAATLYNLLTSRLPLPAKFRSETEYDLIPPKQYELNISDRTNQAILEGMALEPEDRPKSVKEWLNLLKFIEK